MRKQWKLAGLLLATMLAGNGCGGPGIPDNGEAHQQMLTILKEQQATFQHPENLFANTARASYYDSMASAVPRFALHYQYNKGLDLLNAGQSREAAAIFSSLMRYTEEELAASGLRPYEILALDNNHALCYLRLGEQENCILNHSAASCLLPIAKAGQHQLPEGSEKAYELYSEILERDPTDLAARWMLNIAAMTLGRYPQEVPEKWLIPEKKLASEYPLKKFADRAGDIGFDVTTLSGGLIVDDFTNNGYLDILVSEWGVSDQVRFFVNNADGTFSDNTRAANLVGITGGLNLVQADYDNDGWLDVLVLRGGWLRQFGEQPNSLLRNNGDGTFSDVTSKAGLLSFHPTQTATWADFNNDGWLDLFIGNETSGSEAFHHSELFLSNGDGTFTDVAKTAGVQVNKVGFRPTRHYIKGVASEDYDNDGDIDLYLSTGGLMQSRNFLFRNDSLTAEGIPIFTDVTGKAGLGGDISTFTTWFWDYNNDGHADIFASGYRRSNGRGSITTDLCAEYLGMPHEAEKGYLYRNNGDGTFTNVSAETGLERIMYSMGANFGDLDNDGWPDMYLGTGNIGLNSIMPNRLFRNSNGERFQDVTTASGMGHIQKGHGIAFADIDHDGDQDVLASMGGAFEGDSYQNVFFENPYSGTPEAGNWLGVLLQGEEANRSAIGSRLRLVVEEEGTERKIYSTLNWGGSFGSSPLRQQIGLGKAKEVKLLEIRWAGSNNTETFKNLPANRFIKIVEGSGKVKELPLKQLRIPKKPAGQHNHQQHNM